MKRLGYLWALGALGIMGISASCKEEIKRTPLHVEVAVDSTMKYQLLVNGKEYRIKGAGLEHGDVKALAQAGANSFRTWRTNNGQKTAIEVLDEAYANGLTVSMCLSVKTERHGMNYNDPKAVSEQKEDIRRQILEIKDHPALLTWIIGNELNLEYSNKLVWNAVNDIAKMIKEIDGNHPCTTTLAGVNMADIDYIKPNCPDLDFLSIQMYGDVINLEQRIMDAGWIGLPYIISEWGATGHWEVPATEWGAPIEQSSSEKAASIKARYEKAISQDLFNNLGNYIFLWGHKQECTSTWYGLFSDEGMTTEPIDFMTEVWTGKAPLNSAPRIKSALLDGKDKGESIKLLPGKEYTAVVDAYDVNNDVITYKAEVVFESTDRKVGGDAEKRPDAVANAVTKATIEGIQFVSPAQPGKYRLFVYVYDGKGAVGYVNFPFLVE